jgi:hypothetical protein
MSSNGCEGSGSGQAKKVSTRQPFHSRSCKVLGFSIQLSEGSAVDGPLFHAAVHCKAETGSVRHVRAFSLFVAGYVTAYNLTVPQTLWCS